MKLYNKWQKFVSHVIGEGKKILGVLRAVWKKKVLSLEAKIGMFRETAVPTILYGCEVWTLNAKSRKRINVPEIRCLCCE